MNEKWAINIIYFIDNNKNADDILQKTQLCNTFL